MSWFERITGFAEQGYSETQSKLAVEGRVLRSLVNGRSFQIGELELVSLQRLRARLARQDLGRGRLQFSNVSGDVRQLHLSREYEGALFQVASQFNLLEMVGPNVTPEDGVSDYAFDRTQGPACAIAAGAATIYRNYFVPVGQQVGQTADAQLNALAELGEALAADLSLSASSVWAMRNGYALPTLERLDVVGRHICGLEETARDRLRSLLQIGVHRDIEVTDAPIAPGPLVSQAFCSAMPVAYSRIPAQVWAPMAQLVLEAAYEATLAQGALNLARGNSNIVLLTRLGGGAFGNDPAWIDAALIRALELFAGYELDVRMVNYGPPCQSMIELEHQMRSS